MSKPQFKIEDIVGVATGILLGQMGGIYEVMSHLAGRPVFTHELPVLFERSSAAIYAEYPDLEKERLSAGQPEKIPAFIVHLKSTYGETLPLNGKISTEGSHALLAGKEVIVVEAGAQ